MSKILVVDDSPFYRRLLIDELRKIEKLELESTSLEITEADSKETALQQIKKNQPEVVLLDIVMRDNEVEGVQILENLHRDNPSIKVIVISSVGQESVTKKCRQLGVTDYIGKPFDYQQLTLALKKNLKLNGE